MAKRAKAKAVARQARVEEASKRPWLQPGLFQNGHVDLTAKKHILRTLIDAFNKMLREVSALPQFKHVTFVELRGSLSQGAGYKDDWANELHPTHAGFRAVAGRIAARI